MRGVRFGAATIFLAFGGLSLIVLGFTGRLGVMLAALLAPDQVQES